MAEIFYAREFVKDYGEERVRAEIEVVDWGLGMSMGQGPSGGLNGQGDRKADGRDKKEKKFEPAAPPSRVGRKQRKQKGPEAAARLPTVTPSAKCKLRLMRTTPLSLLLLVLSTMLRYCLSLIKISLSLVAPF